MIVPCKVCGASAPLHGVVDFNKSCEAHRGVFFPLLGEEVWYHRCDACGFLFTTHFDAWDRPRWREVIYNDDYHLFDPDGADGSRATANAALVCHLAREQGVTSILDFGGGDGTLARHLVGRGFDAWSWDEFRGGRKPPYHVPLVTAFEVLEHTPRPIDTTRHALAWLVPGGQFLFSTLTLDDLPTQAMDHWYIAPRNGHVSIHTTRSLDLMFGAEGYTVRHLTPGLHLASVPGSLPRR